MYKRQIEHSVCSDQRIARFLNYYPNLTEEDYHYLGITPKQYTLEKCPDEFEFFDKFVEKGLIDKLNTVITVSYTHLRRYY